MNKPLVSVLMPVYNGAKFLAATIENILSQSYKNIELIIVDDGSRDSSYSIANQYSLIDNRIKLFTQPHIGAWAARNKAFQESSGEYIQYMDADDLLSYQKIEKQIELLDDTNEYSIISSEWDFFYLDITEAKFPYRCIYRDYSKAIDMSIDMLNSGEMMLVSCWLIHRKIISQAGGWEQNITIKDDVLFFTKVLALAHKVIFCPNAYVYYRKGHTSLSTTNTCSEQYLKSALAAFKIQAKILLSIDSSLSTRTGIARNMAILMCSAKYNSMIYQEARDEIYLLKLKPVHPYKNSKADKISHIIGFEFFLKYRPILKKICSYFSFQRNKKFNY